MKPCNHPGCPSLVKGSVRYCANHEHKNGEHHRQYNKLVRAKDPALALAHKIRKSPAWLKLRRQMLYANPLCADPFGKHARANTTESASQVHHIKGLRTHPELWNHHDNLQCLCTGCHSVIEQAVRRATKDEPEPSSKQPDPTETPSPTIESLGRYF
jgi:5-methylcytosine-specific restriction endonuclease McrA